MSAQDIEWPRKRRAGPAPWNGFSDEVFEAAAKAAAPNHVDRIRRIADAVLAGYRNQAEPKDEIARLNECSQTEPNSDKRSADDVDLAFACVEVLKREPSVGTWIYLWSLSWHSWGLEHALPKAVRFSARLDGAFKAQFIGIAAGVIKEAIRDPGRRAIQRDRELLPQMRDEWLESPSLTNIWSGVVERHSMQLHYRDDDGVFGILADIDPKAFLDLLGEFDHPYPIAAGLESARWSFSRWQTLLSLAPVAFNEDRTWNRSTIVPILLVIAREELAQAQAGPRATEDDIKQATAEVDTLAAATVNVVAGRRDAIECAERWATWLMRECLIGIPNDKPPYPVDASYRSYLDAVLVNAFGKTLSNLQWSSATAADAEPWEPWCYRCVLVSIAVTGNVPMPNADSFLGEWELDHDDWASRKGRQLRDRASFLTIIGKRADAYGTRLLAISLAEARRADRVWEDLWRATAIIREIVEFGDADAADDDGIRGETAAGDLMKLVFGLGLMMLECVTDPNRKIGYERKEVLDRLFSMLTDAVNEMSPIDRFGWDYWNEATRHLALRRLIWPDFSDRLAVVFGPESKPSFEDFVAALSADSAGLFALLQVALRSGVAPERLRALVGDADVDLVKELSFAERLISIDPRRAGIGPDQIIAARSIVGGSTGDK